MKPCYNAEAPKRRVSHTLNSDLLRVSKELGLNLSRIAEEALAVAVRSRLEEVWLAENADAIQLYNERVAALGVFSDDLRRF